jgi:thiol-disulfide isomerase/thioredoxin
MKALAFCCAILVSSIVGPRAAAGELPAPPAGAPEKVPPTEKVKDKGLDLSGMSLDGAAISWKTYEEARGAATSSGKPLLVDFTAEWCGFCKKLDRETFGNEQVILLLREHFTTARVDVDKEADLAKKFGVTGIPVVLFLSPRGAELLRIVGFKPPEEFLKDARKAVDSSATLLKLKEAAEKNPGDVEALQAYARALFAAGSREESGKLLRAALEGPAAKGPHRTAVLLDLADAERISGKLKEAREAYEKILALEPEEAGEERARAFLPLGRILIELKEQDRAVRVLDELIAGSGRDNAGEDSGHAKAAGGQERLEALFLRGYAHAVLKDAAKALADLKAAREADPDGRWGLRAGLIIDTVETK